MEFGDSGPDTLLPLVENKLSRRAVPFIFALVAERFRSGIEADFLIVGVVAGATGLASSGGVAGARASWSCGAGADSFSNELGSEDGGRESSKNETELDLFGTEVMEGSSGRGGGSLSMEISGFRRDRRETLEL